MMALALRPAIRRSAPPVVMPSSKRQRARTAVLGGALAVLAAHLWLAVQVETEKPHWRDPEFFHRTRAAAALAKVDRRPMLAILGGSRPQMGLNPESLGNETLAFNFAQTGCLPVGENLNLMRLLDAGLEPRFVLIEVLPPVLADPGPMKDRIPLERLGHTDLRHHDVSQIEWANRRLESWSVLRLPLLANWGFSEVFPHRDDPHRLWSAMSPRGWSPAPTRPVTAEGRAARTAVAHRTYAWLLEDFTIQPVNDAYYRAMLKTCRERDMHAALFIMPESPTFRSWYPDSARRRLDEYLQSLAAEHGVPLFDCSAWFNDESAFLDGHHLQRVAATAFSERFGRECVQPWVARKP